MVSSTDKVAFTTAVGDRFAMLLNVYQAKKLRQMEVPPHIKKDLMRSRQMLLRYRAENFRHTKDEEEAEKRVAQWIIERWHELHGTTPPQVAFDF